MLACMRNIILSVRTERYGMHKERWDLLSKERHSQMYSLRLWMNALFTVIKLFARDQRFNLSVHSSVVNCRVNVNQKNEKSALIWVKNKREMIWFSRQCRRGRIRRKAVEEGGLQAFTCYCYCFTIWSSYENQIRHKHIRVHRICSLF